MNKKIVINAALLIFPVVFLTLLIMRTIIFIIKMPFLPIDAFIWGIIIPVLQICMMLFIIQNKSKLAIEILFDIIILYNLYIISGYFIVDSPVVVSERIIHVIMLLNVLYVKYYILFFKRDWFLVS